MEGLIPLLGSVGGEGTLDTTVEVFAWDGEVTELDTESVRVGEVISVEIC